MLRQLLKLRPQSNNMNERSLTPGIRRIYGIGEGLTTIPVGYCHRCKHKYKSRLGCKAYPDGIPDELLLNEMKHDIVYPNQKGDYVFEDEG